MPQQPSPNVFARHAEAHVVEALADTRVVVVHGPRQAGKSTLVQALADARPGSRLVTLDDPPILAAARADPVLFTRHDGLLVIDEVQRAPELLLPIKAAVDRDPRPGRFLLTGSAHVLALPRLADSLAGRMEVIELAPLTQGEIARTRETFIDRLFAAPSQWPAVPQQSKKELLARAAAGGFPEARRRAPGRRRDAWFRAYLRAYVDRDVRDIAGIEHRARLRTLIALLAARTANLLNVDDLARDSRLPSTTARRYLEVLEASFLVTRVPAWSSNQTQRTVSAPKVYIADSGLCAHLLGVDIDALAQPGGAAGPLMETFVLMEVRRQLGWSATDAALHHLRTKDKLEVDGVLEARDGRVAGIEVKAGASVSGRDFRGLRWLAGKLGSRFTTGVVLYAGEEPLSFGPGFWALPMSMLWT